MSFSQNPIKETMAQQLYVCLLSTKQNTTGAGDKITLPASWFGPTMSRVLAPGWESNRYSLARWLYERTPRHQMMQFEKSCRIAPIFRVPPYLLLYFPCITGVQLIWLCIGY